MGSTMNNVVVVLVALAYLVMGFVIILEHTKPGAPRDTVAVEPSKDTTGGVISLRGKQKAILVGSDSRFAAKKSEHANDMLNILSQTFPTDIGDSQPHSRVKKEAPTTKDTTREMSIGGRGILLGHIIKGHT